MEDSVLEMFENINCSDNIQLNMDVVEELESLSDYLEGWRMRL